MTDDMRAYRFQWVPSIILIHNREGFTNGNNHYFTTKSEQIFFCSKGSTLCVWLATNFCLHHKLGKMRLAFFTRQKTVYIFYTKDILNDFFSGVPSNASEKLWKKEGDICVWRVSRPILCEMWEEDTFPQWGRERECVYCLCELQWMMMMMMTLPSGPRVWREEESVMQR